MTPEQQRITIAQACGYKDVAIRMTEGTIRVITGFKNHSFDEEVPDYLNDLNAMHEAVMTLNVKQRSEFRNQLQYLIAPSTKPNQKVSGIKVMGSHHYDEWWHATAVQRAEAFLKTLNLWKSE